MSIYPVLDKINSHDDLICLDPREYGDLCKDIRRFLVDNVSQTGGHLASNLGIVELSVALHLEFDSSRDRIIFDVGHQSYVHKILTGRRDGFASLRTFGGMSGFPKPSESVHDAFIAGHASTSVSAAVGMARARTIEGEKYHVVALIGDGALTGGLAYEGLNDAGRSGEPLVVILNDNEMSISKNVGAMAEYLSKIRLKPSYARLKYIIRKINSKLFRGEYVNEKFHYYKEKLKKLILPSSVFENMGFVYIGPVDGHDIKTLREMIKYAKRQARPTLIHVKTSKGKGYKYSEEHPDRYHGTKKFDVSSGESIDKTVGDFSKIFGETMCRIAKENNKLCAITAAMPDGTGLGQFSSLYPHRFFDVGIAEEHAVTMAAAMAKQGVIPVFAVYSTFLQRGYDQLIHDVALSNVHAIFAIDRAGIVGEDGETHQGIFDISFLSAIPNISIFCPASFEELATVLRHAVYNMTTPVAIRYPKGCEGRYSEDIWQDVAVLKSSKHAEITMVAYGTIINNVIDAAQILENSSVCADVIKILKLKPLKTEEIALSVKKTGNLIIVEDCVNTGSAGQQIVAALAMQGICPKIRLINVGDAFLCSGSVRKLQNFLGLDANAIARSAYELLRREVPM